MSAAPPAPSRRTTPSRDADERALIEYPSDGTERYAFAVETYRFRESFLLSNVLDESIPLAAVTERRRPVRDALLPLMKSPCSVHVALKFLATMITRSMDGGIQRFPECQDRSSGVPMCTMVHEGRRLDGHGVRESAVGLVAWDYPEQMAEPMRCIMHGKEAAEEQCPQNGADDRKE